MAIFGESSKIPAKCQSAAVDYEGQWLDNAENVEYNVCIRHIYVIDVSCPRRVADEAQMAAWAPDRRQGGFRRLAEKEGRPSHR
jgi:hypothetical protein